MTEQIRMAELVHLKSEFNWVYEGKVAEAYRHTETHYPGQSALLIERGSLLVETENGQVRAKPNQWIFPRQGPREQHFSDDAEILSIHFKLFWPGGEPLFKWDTAFILESADAPLLEKRARALGRLVERLHPGAGNNLLEVSSDLKSYFTIEKNFIAWTSLFVETLLDAGASPSRLGHTDHRALQAVAILDDLPVSVAFDANWLSNEVGLSPSQLDRVFIKQFGTTPRQYFDKRKQERAVELIRSAPKNIKEIAYEVGFQSLPCFSRWFRSKTGFSPRQFRKSGGILYG